MENLLNIHASEVLTVLHGLRNEVDMELEVGGVKKGKRKRLKTIVKILDKINANVNDCIEITGSCDGLIMTIAKGNPKSRKIKCGDYIVSNIVNSKKPTYSFGKPNSRYKIIYYSTHDENLFVEDTRHQVKIQASRKIRLVGTKLLKKRKLNILY